MGRKEGGEKDVDVGGGRVWNEGNLFFPPQSNFILISAPPSYAKGGESY